ncbi:DUF7507 domain-containing protein, partial [Dietzia cinnamea]
WKAGEKVTYRFVVTNSGNVTLTNVAVNEGTFSGTGTLSEIECEASELAPGESTNCLATYELTQADVNAGVVKNVAKAVGTPPSGEQVTSPEAPAEVKGET